MDAQNIDPEFARGMRFAGETFTEATSGYPAFSSPSTTQAQVPTFAEAVSEPVFSAAMQQAPVSPVVSSAPGLPAFSGRDVRVWKSAAARANQQREMAEDRRQRAWMAAVMQERALTPEVAAAMESTRSINPTRSQGMSKGRGYQMG